MKTIYTLCLLCLTAWAASGAEAAKPAAAATNEMIIEADGGFEYEAPTATYRRNVHVTDPQMELMCELLTVYFQTNNNKVELLMAETNVIIIEKDNWAIGDKAVYNVTNDVVHLTGNVLIDTPQGYVLADTVIFDRKKNKLSVPPGPVKMGGTILSGTNAAFPSIFGDRGRTNAPPKNPDKK